MDINEFAQKVKEMRKVQKSYFAAAKVKAWDVANGHLKKAKELEKEIDQIVEETLTGTTQPELF